MSTQRIILRSTAVYALATLLERGAIITVAFLASLNLSPADYSQFGRFQIAATMIAGYATLGMSTLVTKLAAELQVNRGNEERQIKQIWQGAVAVSLGLAFLYIIIQLISGLGRPLIHTVSFIFLAVTLASALIASAILLGLEDYRSALVVSSGFFVALLSSVAVASNFNTVSAYVLSFALGHIVWAALAAKSAAQALRRIRFSERTVEPGKHDKRVRKLFLQASPLILVSAISGGLVWTMSTILLSQTNETEHAKFLIGLQWAAIVTFLPSVITRVIFPVVVRSAVDQQSEQKNRLMWLAKSTAATALITALAAVLFTASSKLISGIYPPYYSDITEVILVYIICSMPASVANLFGNQLIAEGGSKHWLTCTAIGSGVLLTSMLLTGHLGAFAPAIAMGIGYSVMILAALRYLHTSR